MADAKLSALAAISVPALADPLYGEQGGTEGQYTLTRLGGLLTPSFTTGRLTLVSGNAVPIADQSAKGTLYYTSVDNDGTITAQNFQIVIFDGTRLRMYNSAEISLALTLTSGKAYDVFIYDNAGTLTLELSAAWTNDTTRANALAAQSGTIVKSGTTTRRWIGTIYASGANQTSDTALLRYVANAYNAVDRAMDTAMVAQSHAGANNSTWIEWALNPVRLNFVLARAHPIVVNLFGEIATAGAGAGSSNYLSANIDVVSGTGKVFFPGIGITVGSTVSCGASGVFPSQVPGKHAIIPLEFSQNVSATFQDYQMTARVLG